MTEKEGTRPANVSGPLMPTMRSGASRVHGLHTAGALILAAARGEDPNRVGIRDTPDRFFRAYSDLLSGYGKDPKQVVGLGVFPAEGSGLVCVENLEFFSLCEHHLLPFWGTASVAYFPQETILGLSKIPRLVDLFSHRLQLQERLTSQVLAAIRELIQPRAVAVKIKGQHMCMMMRGVKKQSSFTITQELNGYESLEEFEKKLMDTFLSD